MQKKLVFITIALLFLALYLLTTNQNFTYDALIYAWKAEHGRLKSLIHPNHPLHPLLGFCWYRLEKLFGYTGLAVYSLARFNGLATALGLGVFFLAASSVMMTAPAAALTAFLGVCYAVWFHAIDATAAGGIVILLVSSVLWQSLRMARQKAVRPKDALLLGLLSVAYTLAHGIGIFHIPALAGWLWTQNQKRAAQIYLLAALGGVGAAMVGFYLFLFGSFSVENFAVWAGGYATTQGLANIGHSGFWVSDLPQLWWIVREGWSQSMLASGPPHPPAVQYLSWVIGATTLMAVVAGWINAKSLPPSLRRWVRALDVWGALVFVFVSVWGSGTAGFLGFRNHILFPWALATALIFSARPLFSTILWAMAGGVFIFNLSGPIYHNGLIANNKGYTLMSEIHTHMKPGDTLVCATGRVIENVDVVGPYFFPDVRAGSLPGRLFAKHETSLVPFQTELRARMAQGTNVFITPDLLDASMQALIEESRLLPEGEVQKFLKGFDFKEGFVLSNGLTVYRLTSRP